MLCGRMHSRGSALSSDVEDEPRSWKAHFKRCQNYKISITVYNYSVYNIIINVFFCVFLWCSYISHHFQAFLQGVDAGCWCHVPRSHSEWAASLPPLRREGVPLLGHRWLDGSGHPKRPIAELVDHSNSYGNYGWWMLMIVNKTVVNVYNCIKLYNYKVGSL